MTTGNDRRSEGGAEESKVAGSAAARRGGGSDSQGRPWTARARTATWEVLNAPVGVAVSVVVAFGSMAALMLSVFLGQFNRMEDRLGDQIRELREAIEEVKDSNEALGDSMVVLERRLMGQINELGDSMVVRDQRLLGQINELGDSMVVRDQRLLAEIDRRMGDNGDQ